MKVEVIIGIDLAGKQENPTGWAIWKNKTVKTRLVYTDDEIIENVARNRPMLTAIDAPFALPRIGINRKADEEMVRKGYRVFPPGLPAMRKLTLRAIELNKILVKEGYKTIEVHPTSTRKALNMPSKDWKKIQAILSSIGLKGDPKECTLTPHEIDAVTAALTAYLHVQNQTESLGDDEEGYIIVPKKQNWSMLKL